ncbi:MAG: TonB-dependent receptor [Bacteroidales bacterium]|nr:TonB-dependent receptor [Bacteroidales bacterium]
MTFRIKNLFLILFWTLFLSPFFTKSLAQGVISGIVRDQYGNALSGVSITVKEFPEMGAYSDSAGHYELHLNSSIECTVCATLLGYDQICRRYSEKSNGKLDFMLDNHSQELDMVVVTGTRTPKPLKDAPIITRVITQKEIQQLDVTNVQELLQAELPGVEFSYSMNQQVSLNMQGFGGNSVLFLIDGERLAGETLDNVDYSRLLLADVSHIEIVKGSASSLYGSNAVGGVVNIITKQIKQPWSLNLNARYGSHNQQCYGGSVGFNLKGFNNMLTAQFVHNDPITLKNSGDIGNVYGFNSFDIKDKFSYSYKDKVKITARAGYFFRERATQELSHERYRDFSGGLKGEYKITPLDDITLSYTFDQYDKSDYSITDKLDVRDYSNVQHTLRGIYSRTFRKKHILTLGGDYMRDYLMSYQFADHGAYYQHTADAFAQFDWNPLKKLNVIAGVRYDYFSSGNLHHVSPKLSLMYKLKHFSLRASYANGFRSPTLKERYMQFDMANIFMIYGNPDLNPETSHNFSLAGEYSHGSYNVTLIGFYNRVRNRITTVWNNEMKGMVYTNMVPLHVTGCDFTASASWKFGLSVRASYVFTKEIIPKGQPEISVTRPHSATFRINYAKEWKKYGFSVMLSGRVLSGVTCDEYTSMTSFDETRKVTYPAYTIWKFGFNQTIMKGLNLNFVLDNLFNYVPDYYYSNTPATTGMTFNVGVSVDVDEFFKNKSKSKASHE